MNKIELLDKKFELSITSGHIQNIISEIADRMNNDLKGKDIIFISILTGAFMFTADLCKKLNLNCQISFVKIASYKGTSTTGKVNKLIGINENLKNKTVIILEDIVDTGITLENIINQINEFEPNEIKIATLFFKSETYQKKIQIDYIGMKIPDKFIVGYGLDYEGYGRNLEDVYTIIN